LLSVISRFLDFLLFFAAWLGSSTSLFQHEEHLYEQHSQVGWM
jgi:hypothetical protein